MSEQAPFRFLETTIQVKETRFQVVIVPSAGFLKLTTILMRVFWFSKVTLSMMRVQKALVQPVWKPVRAKPYPRTSTVANLARERSWQQSLLAPLLQVSRGLSVMSPVASLGMRETFWQVFLKLVWARTAQTSKRHKKKPFIPLIQKSSKANFYGRIQTAHNRRLRFIFGLAFPESWVRGKPPRQNVIQSIADSSERLLHRTSFNFESSSGKESNNSNKRPAVQPQALIENS